MAPFSTTALSRRTSLKLALASLWLSACQPKSANLNKHIAVIGGGIIGASIAYHLAKSGAKVTLLERRGLAERASRGTFAWINATWAKQPRHYHQFNQAGVAGWKRFEAELGIPVRFGGSLEWFPSESRQDLLTKQIAEQVEWGEPAEMLAGQALRDLEPRVEFGDVNAVAYSPTDAAVDPVLATLTLAKAATALGATIKTDCPVHSVQPSENGGVILETACGDIAVDEYVIATGADAEATQKLAGIDIPQRTTPGVIAVTKPMPRLINRIIVAPGVHIHQRDDGRIVLGEQSGAPDTAAHAERLRGRPNIFPDQSFSDMHADRILAIAEQYVPGIADAEIEDVFIGWRPLPIDGHPVLGQSPNQPLAYLAITHSGVSLAPIIGDVVAKEILTDQSVDSLAEYRPNRNFKAVRRY